MDTSEKLDGKEIWEKIYPTLEESFGAGAFNGWLKFLKFCKINGNRVYLSAPSRFLRDWITNRYASDLLSTWKTHLPDIHSLEIIVIEEDTPPLRDTINTHTQELEAEDADLSSNLLAGLDLRFTFENFVVGKPNELAYAAAMRVADAESVYFNPLFLYGGVGLGKTHLMHAVAWHLKKEQPTKKVIYMSAEKFMYQFIRALRHKDIISFREQFRSVDVLMIDDVQFISGKDSTQEEFFHTFNALVDQKRQIIISADKSPSDLRGIEERMRSRLGWGLVADIHPTTYELRLGILQSKRETLSTPVPDNVLEFLAHKVTSNIRELEGALNRIVAHVTLVGSKISIETTQQVLKDLLRANEKSITIDNIQKHIAEHYNIRISDLHSNKRLRIVARPRQIAMYLSKKHTTRSLQEIGRKFGGRDHTTVLHAIKKVEELIKQDPAFHDDISMIERIITS